MRWMYGVTTVPQRINTTFPRTIDSLRRAGFDQPHLFVDGDCDPVRYERFYGLNITTRYPKTRINANWMLSLAELYARDPWADRYAMFQDDVVLCRNVRQYLEALHFPEQTYVNLYVNHENQAIIPSGYIGFHQAAKLGRGALALVFVGDSVPMLLTHYHMIYKLRDKSKRGWRFIDGGIVDTFRLQGWREVVHNPSLVYHIGHKSTHTTGTYPASRSFPGEDFDALSLRATV